jgi:hypothetical protein
MAYLRIYLTYLVKTAMFLFDEEENENKMVASKHEKLQVDGTRLSVIHPIESGSGEGAKQPLPEELNRTVELPSVNQQDLPFQSHQSSINNDKSKEAVKFEKLCNQLSQQLKRNDTIGTLRQIQKKLKQIDNMLTLNAKQQIILKQMSIQIKTIQKHLDKNIISINRFKIQELLDKNKSKLKAKVKGKTKGRKRSK